METEKEIRYKRLYRSEDDRIIAGICGGLGEYFTIDPVIIRLIWVLTLLIGGSGIVIYLLAWLLVPRKPMDTF